MEFTRQSCRLCLSTTEFYVGLYSEYSRKTKMLEKLLNCYDVVINESDHLTNICYKCSANVEQYYDSISMVRKSQEKICKWNALNSLNAENANRCVISKSYVREQVSNADYTYSFLEVSFNKVVCEEPKKSEKRQTRRQSKDMFESSSQDSMEDYRNVFMDWKLTPNDDLMRRVREKVFGRSDF